MHTLTLRILGNSVSDNKQSRTNQAGYTLAEVVVVITVMAIISVVFLGMITSYFVVINRTNLLTNMTVDSQNLLRTTVENIRFGDGVRQTNQISDSHAPGGGWNTSNVAFVIIIAVPALDTSHTYIIDPNTGSPYMNELVYYKSGTTLMQRKLANPNATGNRMFTTCPANLATTTCTADLKLADYVNTMIFTLYDQDGVQTNTVSLARSVKINLNMKRSSPGTPINLDTNIRVTLRNRF